MGVKSQKLSERDPRVANKVIFAAEMSEKILGISASPSLKPVVING
jgi:hypothetical protein